MDFLENLPIKEVFQRCAYYMEICMDWIYAIGCSKYFSIAIENMFVLVRFMKTDD